MWPKRTRGRYRIPPSLFGPGAIVIKGGAMPDGYVPPSGSLEPPPAQPSTPTDTSQAELLTEAEHQAIDLTAQLWNLITTEIITNGPARDNDTTELAAHLHAIQHTLLAQAAARAYPTHYRLLGGHPPPNVTRT